jgi:glycosyltransferase involved in cell wall biosynthesis
VNQWAPDRACAQVTDNKQLQQARDRYGLAGKCPYFFGFGASDPRKNTRGLLEAWAKLPETMRSEYRLLLVGIDQAALTEFGELKSSLGLGDSCVLAGFAAEQDVPALLSGATALCYPSLSEGFGLPILDAFTCCTPVLAADATSLPEVAGDAAVLVDPSDPGAIAAGLKRLIEDDSLRVQLVQRGSERVRAFTWEACADRAAAAIEAAANGRA